MRENQLAAEQSPYLLQHKNNPVNWQPWGPAAFEMARLQNKPIFLSIGYSTCYWCHVMEQDSFENDFVADILNQKFISIKVDREERPDVDALYMSAVVALQGQGGWPLSVFLTPDLQPFWGGTYFPRAQFISILGQISAGWQAQDPRLKNAVSELTARLQQLDVHSAGQSSLEVLSERAFEEVSAYFDPTDGGFGAAPKFPPAQKLGFLLRYYKRTRKPEVAQMLHVTLEHMARGGIYDQLAGGFARYATDRHWLIPHFEKMLYDNALLARVYLEAYQLFKVDLYLAVVKEVLGFIRSDMQASEGYFFCAQDAGEVGREGEYYIWDFAELKQFLTAKELATAGRYFSVSAEGNFEGKNILTYPVAAWEKRRTDPDFVALKKKMLTRRSLREAPHLDDKCIVSWNALMITTLAQAGLALTDSEYTDEALRAMNFIKDTLWDGQNLLRRYRAEVPGIPAQLEDYSYLCEAALALFLNTQDRAWLDFAETLHRRQHELFWDAEAGGYFSSDAVELIVRQKEYFDNAQPSGNSVTLANLRLLYQLTFKSEYEIRLNQLLKSCSGFIESYATAASYALQTIELLQADQKQVVIVSGDLSPQQQEYLKTVRACFMPEAIIIQGRPEALDTINVPWAKDKESKSGQLTIYICKAGLCQAPVDSFDSLLESASLAAVSGQ